MSRANQTSFKPGQFESEATTQEEKRRRCRAMKQTGGDHKKALWFATLASK